MEREFPNLMLKVLGLSISISVSTGTESQHRSFVDRYGSPSGLQGERSWLEVSKSGVLQAAKLRT